MATTSSQPRKSATRKPKPRPVEASVDGQPIQAELHTSAFPTVRNEPSRELVVSQDDLNGGYRALVRHLGIDPDTVFARYDQVRSEPPAHLDRPWSLRSHLAQLTGTNEVTAWTKSQGRALALELDNKPA